MSMLATIGEQKCPYCLNFMEVRFKHVRRAAPYYNQPRLKSDSARRSWMDKWTPSEWKDHARWGPTPCISDAPSLSV